MNYALSKDHQGGKAEMTAHVVKPLQYQVMDITVAGYYDFRKDVTKVDDQKKYLAINGGGNVVSISAYDCIDYYCSRQD